MSKIKSIGHVVTLSSGGFVARVERYPSGRKLPEPRLLLDDGKPFASPHAAMAALAQWKDAPRTVRQLTVTRDTPAPVAPAPVVKAKPAPAAKPEPVRKAKAVPANLPPVVKLMDERGPSRRVRTPDSVSQKIAELIAAGIVEVTRCLPGQERNYVPKHGGVCPGHLNPVTMR